MAQYQTGEKCNNTVSFIFRVIIFVIIVFKNIPDDCLRAIHIQCLDSFY